MPDLSATGKPYALTVSGAEWGELLRTVLEKKAQFRFKAAGISMSPFIRNGDVVTIGPLGRSLPPIGAIVAFIHPTTNKIAVHRLVDREGPCFRVKGDNNRTTGAAVGLADILGQVTRIERNGRCVRWATGPGSRLIAVFSRWGFLLWGVWFLQRLQRVLRRGSQYE